MKKYLSFVFIKELSEKCYSLTNQWPRNSKVIFVASNSHKFTTNKKADISNVISFDVMAVSSFEQVKLIAMTLIQKLVYRMENKSTC